VIDYREGTSEPSAAVSLDPESGKETVLLLFGRGDLDVTMDIGEPPDIVYEQGRIFLARTDLSRLKGDAVEGPRLPVREGHESSG
jgi:hypothetical protein